MPIRFVARKQHTGANRHRNIAEVIRDLREMTAVDHRISTAYASSVAKEQTEGSDSNTFLKEHKRGEEKANGEGGFVLVDRDDGETSVTIEEL